MIVLFLCCLFCCDNISNSKVQIYIYLTLTNSQLFHKEHLTFAGCLLCVKTISKKSYIRKFYKLHCKSCDFKAHCSVYSGFFINFMIHNMFCNPAAVVGFLLFLFWSLCFNKYIFYSTKAKPTQCLMCPTGSAVGVSRTKTQRRPAPKFSDAFFCLQTQNIQFLYIFSLCLIWIPKALDL